MTQFVIAEIKTPVKYPTGHAIILAGSSEIRNSRSVGAYRTATVLRNKGWEIDVLDYLTLLTDEQLTEYLEKTFRKDGTKWIGISYTWMVGSTRSISLIKKIKELYPDTLLIIGGQFPYTQDLSAEWYIFGYGEKAIDAVLEYEFSTGAEPINTPLFAGKYINAYKDYPATPYLDYSVEYTEDDHIVPQNHMGIELSRGCKFACKFCSFPFIGMKEDSSSEEETLYRELNENYQKWGVTCYNIADDTLNDRTSKLRKLSNVVQRLDFNPDFKAFVRLDLLKAHPEQVELLAGARAWIHYYGIETFNKRAGTAIGKGMDGDKLKELLFSTRGYFNKHLGLYRGTAGMIAGLPYETIEDMKASNKWFVDNWSDQNWMWWSLSIYRERGILSAFGEDLAKFGYSEISDADKDINREKTITRPINEIIWKSNITNIYECADLVSEFQKGDAYLNCFATIQYLGMYDQDYNKVLNIRHPIYPQTDTIDFRKKSLKMAKIYLEKKLKN
jgi:hypothetical protein